MASTNYMPTSNGRPLRTLKLRLAKLLEKLEDPEADELDVESCLMSILKGNR